MGGMCNGMDGRKGTAMKALRHRLAELDSGVRNAWLLIAILVVALICTMRGGSGGLDSVVHESDLDAVGCNARRVIGGGYCRIRR